MKTWSSFVFGISSPRIALLGSVLGGAAVISAGCADGRAPESESETADSTAQALAAPVCAPEIDPMRSLLVTDPTVLARFPLQSVLNQILATAGVSGPPALDLYRRWWDTQNTTAGAFFTDSLAIHCDSQLNPGGQPAINDFPIQCPRNEGALANPANPLTDPFIDGKPAARPNFMKPVAVINRFDLAPTDGSHCGEYRIIFEKKSGEVDALNRTTIIFEGVLPNPDPGCGLLACRPVADFWAGLSSETDPNILADKIEEFYFAGLPGFEPVISASHYGMGAVGGGYGATSKGQVRTNQFMPGPNNQIWQLREFQLERVCKGVKGGIGIDDPIPMPVDPTQPQLEQPEGEGLEEGGIIEPIEPLPSVCFLRFKPVTVKNNPFGPMFASSSTDPRTTSFRSDFAVNQVEPLSSNNIDFITMATPDAFNAGQSNAQGTENDYRAQINLLPVPVTFVGDITAQLTALGRTDMNANANPIADRATTQSCGGCHQLSNNDRLGGVVDPRWPPSATFVHVDEFSNISSALQHVFLPHRKTVLRNYLDTTCNEVCNDCGSQVLKAQAAPGSDNTQVKTLGGSSTH